MIRGIEAIAVNRTDFQQLAEVRIDEAGVLLALGKHDGAYYLAGYAVECGLKACIAKLTNQHDFPPQREFVQDCYTHKIEILVKSAGLKASRDADAQADIDLAANWAVVKDWNESSRYERKTRADAQTLYDAITEPAHGVLPWIRHHW